MTARLKHESAPSMDYLLVIGVSALIIVGLMMVYSTTFYLGYELHNQAHYFFIRQLVWVSLGLITMVIMARIEYHTWLTWSIPIMAGTLLLLGIVLLFGSEKFNAQRWLFNGSIQPSEMAKLAVIIYLANWLSSKNERIRQVTYGLAPFAILIGFVIGLIILQRDLSTAILIALTTLSMFFIAGGQIWQMVASGIVASISFMLLITRSPYRLARLTAFMDPFSDPLGQNYQIQQILIALGTGGITGLGLGASRQKFGAIPASHTDGIFAILGEELGLIGGLIVIGLFAFIAYRGFKISLAAPDTFGSILAVGITCSLIFQALINIGVVTATLPFTGIPLPFISSGGSSMLVSLASIGLLLSISRRTMPVAKTKQKLSKPATYGSHWQRRTGLATNNRRSKA
ncbi:MAG: putative lipid II flippase FtsW [Chloroflexota bacterium]